MVGCDLLWFSREEKTKQILFVKSKFVFLYVDSEFDVLKRKFIMKNDEKWQFKIPIVFLPIIVADTKITCGCNFVASLITWRLV